MSDIQAKCTRCRHACALSEWIDVPSKKFGGCTEQTCPRCGCKTYYDQTPLVAWCWASGLIEVGETLPADKADGSGVIQIATGPKSELELALKTLARHARLGTGLLVPGVPEATGQSSAIRALEDWLAWCQKGGKRASARWPGVVWASKGGA